MVKKILSIIVWTASVLGLLVLFAFARQNYLDKPVTGIDIRLIRQNQTGFLTHSELLNRVITLTDSAKGKPIRQFKLRKIKADMRQNPWIEEVDVSTTLEGKISVRVNERDAFLRAYNRKNESVYIGRDGTIFPTNPAYASRVIIASGYLDFPGLKGQKTASIFDSAYRKT
ncbi:MAG: FtsQ-type POTRA domain-containing protein, partial [Bacteroidales bacterium]|nr:FtsQ-type POTRA domain-containing protein [Bacteroidales bacterium]